ncbi:apolipoprotein B-100 isoform X5 [Perca fluviatilis]|uniref:apolipoprotein B-100 isoform X5 n=1 Tax=Perca fluviatilis TaxID=8168 RepID=UPI001966C170|nr:apolipoprotein B-100 isoform X5 [Perca fluviatilis]
MMGYIKLCLLLLLSSYTLAQEGNGSNEQSSTCLLASRFKTYKKYVYQYTTASRNGVVGTANLKNGPKVSCQVEIEVPQMCRFVMHTRDCALSEVSVMDPQGQPVYRQAPGSEAFQAAMERHLLRFTVEGGTSVQLFPETDEPVNILNIKRGIVSALNVPVMEDEQNSLMSTVHGQCLTDYLVHARKDIATDVTLSRDLSQCDQFYSRKLVNSPLALLQKLHGPMSKLITSTQDCNYQFDNKGKHITAAMCTEKHIYLPFSHEGNGISSVVTQDLSFQSSKRISNKAFDVNPSQSKPLYFEDPDDKAPIQTKDAVLGTLQELVALAGTDHGQKRTSLFHKLVSSLRVLRNETLSQIVTEMLDMSGWLTWQALFQCGTTECTSAILHTIRSFDGLSPEADALVYGLSLQADPDATRVRDMLSMAQYKQSRAIMYALANTVKKFYKSEVTPVVTDVSKFMETLLNDCTGEIFDNDSDFPTDPEDMSFLVLRVVGVMGQAMQAVSPSLISSILRCARKTNIPLSNQKAAIQAFRLMDINDEVRNIFMEVYKDAKSPVDKRVAAYLILMKNPDQALVRDILYNLENVRDEQLKSFVVSHLRNIRNSGEPQMHQLREYIELALKDQLSPANKVFDGMSSNYKIDSPLGSVQSNIIFGATDTLPKEVMLETTLKVFDYNYDIFEVGVEGTGFEPTIDALFGENGFFPDSISKVMYWAGDKAKMFREVLDRMAPERDRMKRQVPQDLLKDLTNSVEKLMDDARFSSAPEAIAYLRLLGAEIGYIKTSDMKKMSETLSIYYNVFIRVLPVKAYFALISSTENEVFGHYIFMENAFSLPTASGFPLKFSLAGVFAPGAKGGLTYSPANTMTDLSFMPSVGLEFITQMGVHIPDYVEAGLEMHTNMYHESSLNAKITMSRNQMRLSIPAPKSNTQFFSISNKLLSVSSGQTKIVPSLVEDRTDSTDCQPLFYGLKLCTIARYSNATSMDQAPYYPLTGESRFAVEIQPTGEVSEYTATITDETLREGKKGRHKVDSLTLTLKAEGYDSSEATVALRYNRNKNTLTAEVVIPDYDVEAGIKLAVTDSDAKGKKMRGITIDVTNRNIPQLTLVGHSRLDTMKNAMLQIQMAIPSLKTDASVTATLKRDEDVFMDLEMVINLPETSYQQKASIKYNDETFEVELKSHLKSEIQKLIPNIENHHRQLQQLIDHILDQKVAKTDMKLRHIVTKGIEAGDIWLDKLTASIPYLANLRSKRSISDLTLPALPEKLFLQSDSLFRYQFNKDKMAISLPLPHGGKKSEEINIPTTLSIPLIDLPEIGLYIPAKNYPLPSFTIPPSLDFTVPLLGLAEASTKINSNFYSWEGSITGGNNTVDVPSYIAQYKAMAQSPFHLLSYKLEASATLGFNNGVIKLSGKYNFIHSDINVDWQHVLAQNLRMKRQTPQTGSMESRNTLNVDITSRTFVDANFRFASRKDGITASMSCPSSGFLGLQFQRRSPSQLYGKLFSRYLSTPEKDTDVFTAKAMLRNSQFILQTSWNWDFLHDVIEGTKNRIPAMTDAVLKFINKYHTAHFGFDLKRGGMKLKNTVSNVIERVYHEVPVSFTTLQNSINHLSDQGKDMYMKASESLMSMSVQDVIDMLAHKARQLLKHSKDTINVFAQSVTQFMSDTKFTVPGSEEKLSSLDMFQGAHQSVSRTTDRAIQRFASLVEKISKYIREIKFTIPRTDVFNGNEIIDKLMSSIRSVYEHSVHRGWDLLQKTVNYFLQVIGEKAKDFIAHLKDANVEIASQVDAIHAEVLQSSNRHTEEAKRYVAEYKDHAKVKIQEAYNALRMEQVNNDTNKFISILQSHLYSGLNESIHLMRRTTQSTAPYIRVSNKKMDIEIPLPFLWKSFSEWPTQSSQ